jgi:hypothetical protein
MLVAACRLSFRLFFIALRALITLALIKGKDILYSGRKVRL